MVLQIIARTTLPSLIEVLSRPLPVEPREWAREGAGTAHWEAVMVLVYLGCTKAAAQLFKRDASALASIARFVQDVKACSDWWPVGAGKAGPPRSFVALVGVMHGTFWSVPCLLTSGITEGLQVGRWRLDVPAVCAVLYVGVVRLPRCLPLFTGACMQHAACTACIASKQRGTWPCS